MKRKSLGAPAIYAESLKITVAREYLTTDRSYGELAKKHGLKNGAVVRSMVNWYKKHYDLEQLPTTKQATVEPLEPAAASGDTAKDKELREALLKVEALELLIANAQKELGIDLIKKPGTKQPGK